MATATFAPATTEKLLIHTTFIYYKSRPFTSNTLYFVPTLPKPLPATIPLWRSHKKFIGKAITTTAKNGKSTSTGLYAATHSKYSRKMFLFILDLSRRCIRGEFVLVMFNESKKSKALFHEEEGIISGDELMQDVLYYGDNHSAVIQIHSRKDFENLLKSIEWITNMSRYEYQRCQDTHILTYPTVLILSRQLVDTVVFARMSGDENDSRMQFLKDMKMVKVPTFLFIRDGDVCRRYFGSCKANLIFEVHRYRGVRRGSYNEGW
ncbi:hypothetical protein MKW94_006933 [Papaver nudicaule]|uniref:Thioredoxin-like protein n=1 Tax=Papaver nudicaule TaxID=74823 RepID=A0AA41V2M4_PAPNU|nr:hypothetical protein [Papaver nudicaule]